MYSCITRRSRAIIENILEGPAFYIRINQDILKMKKVIVLGLIAILLIMMAGCAPGPNTLANIPDEQGHVAGIWLGLWHGIIAPVTFVISIFDKNVQMYDVHNDGNWYNFGFLLGMAVFFGAGSGGVVSRRKRR
jgi:hypothetical protein